MAWIRAERVCSRRRDTPETPGEAWGPTFSANRRYGTESPRVVLQRAARSLEPVATGYATVAGWLKQPRPRGTLVDRLTCAQTYGRSRGESECRRDAHGTETDVAMAYHPLAED
jgi:hypothetical protein